jgi:hypothetical protein
MGGVERAGLIDAAVRAEIAEARLRAREESQNEIDRLRAVVDALAADNNVLRERVRELEARLRQVDVTTLVGSLAGAVEGASSALETHGVTNFHAEVKAALRVSRTGAGLVLASPGIYPAASLSTLRFDVRRVPPTRAQEARDAAVGVVHSAVLAVQEALDAAPVRDRRAAGAAQAAAAVLLEAVPTADAVRALADALKPIARRRPRVQRAIEVLTGRARALTAVPGAEELEALAAGLTELVAVLPRGRSRESG